MKIIELSSPKNNQKNIRLMMVEIYGPHQKPTLDIKWDRKTQRDLYRICTNGVPGPSWKNASQLGKTLKAMLVKLHGEVKYGYDSIR